PHLGACLISLRGPLRKERLRLLSPETTPPPQHHSRLAFLLSREHAGTARRRPAVGLPARGAASQRRSHLSLFSTNTSPTAWGLQGSSRLAHRNVAWAPLIVLNLHALFGREALEILAQRGVLAREQFIQPLFQAAGIEREDHGLDRPDRGLRHGDRAEAKPDQGHGLERLSRHLATQREGHLVLVCGFNDL